MGKDREGKFHSKKGKPSGSGRTDSTGLKEVNTEHIDDYLEIAEKYTLGEEEPAPNLRVTHPNRNVDKREERTQQKPDNNDELNESYKSKTETFKVQRSDTA